MQITNHRYRRWALAIAMAAAPLGAAATPDPAQAALTLAAAVELALSRGPELALARHEAEASEGAVIQSHARPNPALAYQVEEARGTTRGSTLLLSQAIELGGQRAARIAASERARAIARGDAASRAAQIRAQVGAAFFEVLAGQERAQLARDLLALARQASDAAGKRVRAGKVSPVEETRARIAEATVRAELAQAHSDLAVARQRLSAFWGDPDAGFPRVDGELERGPDVPAVAQLRQRLASSPALGKAQLEIERRQALAELEKARRVPDLTLSLGVKRDEVGGRDQTIVGLSLPLPVFDSNRGHLLEALKREEKARAEALALEHRLHAELMAARGQLEAATQLAGALRADVLPGAHSAYAAASKGFELGKFSFLDLLDAQRTLFQARQHYVRALADAHRAAAEIDRLLGDVTTSPSYRSSP